MPEIYVRGAEDFARLSKAFRSAGLEGKGLRREMLKQINRETKPLKQEAKKNARAILPKRGGLSRRVAATPLSTKTLMTGGGAGVRILGKGKAGARSVKQIDAGRVRHPVWGRRKRWVTQSVSPGWFTDAMKSGADKVRGNVQRAINGIVQRLIG